MDGIQHPQWCDRKRCTVGQAPTEPVHKGMVVPVGDDPKHPLATVWLSQRPGGRPGVEMAFGLTLPHWTTEEAERVGAALIEVARALASQARR
jgi:hypothetical protein